MLFAGHETSANIAHLCLLFLAINLGNQVRLQHDIDSIVGSRPSEDWTYEKDLNNLWHSMVGACINETLRLMPPIIDVPKIVRGAPQPMTYDGKTVNVPTDTIIHISIVGAHRNPRYWPSSPSKLSKKTHNLDDFVPERWLTSSQKSTKTVQKREESSDDDIHENTTTFDSNTSDGLFIPPKGAFLPFSEGARACPGKRFAQVEITAVLAVIFQEYSLELDVSEWATDAEIEKMDKLERRVVYEKAMTKARKLIAASQSEIFLQVRGNYPVKFVRRGGERFKECFG
jgi:cytochrome P450